MKKILAFLLAFLLLYSLCACTGAKEEQNGAPKQVTEYIEQNIPPQKGGILRLALSGADSLNPLFAGSQNDLMVLKLMYDSLFLRAPNDRLENVLCENYSLSEDGLHYAFTIRDGISFHNGAKLSAEDVALSFLLAKKGYYRDILPETESAYSEGREFHLILKEPCMNLPALLDFPVLSKADLGSEEHAEQTKSQYIPNGTGRYKVQSYKKSKELYLSVNQNYHKEFSPFIETIQIYLLKDKETAISMLENIQIDLLLSDVLNLYKYTPKRNLSYAMFGGNTFTFLGLNTQNMALLSPQTRNAISLALSRDEILQSATVKYAESSEFPIPPHSTFVGGRYSVLSSDSVRAKEMLLSDGWQDTDVNGILDKEIYGEVQELTLEILVNEENSARKKIAEKVKGYLTEIGIPTTVSALPFEEYRQRIAQGGYDVFVGSSKLSYDYDLSFFLKMEENPFLFASELSDESLYRLSLAAYPEQILSGYDALCSIISEDRPFVGLYSEYDVLVFDESVKGAIHPSSSDVFYGIEHWFLER